MLEIYNYKQNLVKITVKNWEIRSQFFFWPNFVSDLDLLPEVLLNVCFDKLIQSIRYDWRRCVIH